MTGQARRLLAAAALVALALPALARDRPETILPPGFGDPAEPPPAPEPQPQPQPPARPQSPAGQQAVPLVRGAGATTRAPGEAGDADEAGEAGEEDLDEIPLPVELPARARRDPYRVGVIDPVGAGLGTDPWGGASGAFLSTLMRRMDSPLPSRWLHIALRNALIARVRAPRMVGPGDWVGERAWLLLRLGEADAARMLVAGVDIDRFTPKLFQVAVQSALATSDPAALCPLLDGLRQAEPHIAPIGAAMCAALSGESATASAAIDQARRRGRVKGIDLLLAEKLIGAGSDTRRAVTIEWDEVEQLSAWRFGLATATALAPPERLLAAAPPRVRAWHARAPLLSAQDRLPAAWTATGLGVFSSNALTELYATVHDSTDSTELAEADAWQVRLAFAGKNRDVRLAAMRRLWRMDRTDRDDVERQAARALMARAAARIAPSAELQADAPELIASMLAGGLDRHAERWTLVIDEMDEEAADRSWAMLALGAPSGRLDLSTARVTAFIDRDRSAGRRRSALLVAALAGLGRIDARTAERLALANRLAIGRSTRWSRMIRAAADRRQPGTVVLLAATGMQAASFERVAPASLFHSTAALTRVGQEYIARMIAAEALART